MHPYVSTYTCGMHSCYITDNWQEKQRRLLGKCPCPMITGCWATLINLYLQTGEDSQEEIIPRCKSGLKNKIENGKWNNQVVGHTDT